MSLVAMLWVSPGISDTDSVVPSRYINHSCAPNCVAEVVTFDKEDKIIIISSRRIPKGEEVRGEPLPCGSQDHQGPLAAALQARFDSVPLFLPADL